MHLFMYQSNSCIILSLDLSIIMTSVDFAGNETLPRAKIA
jgi:hypothetical protein